MTHSPLSPFPRLRTAVVSLPLAALVLLGASAYASAEESRLQVALQNDIFAGSDGGGYTNGNTLALLRNTSAGEAAIAPQPLLAPIASSLGVGPASLTVTSLNQLMVTPADITRKVPDPADAPYLGALWLRAAQVSVQGDVADMLAVNVGMIGPASGARQSQRFIHRVTGSERPEGWDYQVGNRPMIGIERYRAVRFASDHRMQSPVWTWSHWEASRGATGNPRPVAACCCATAPDCNAVTRQPCARPCVPAIPACWAVAGSFMGA